MNTKTVDQAGNSALPQVSYETRALVDAISKRAEGTMIAYDELEAIIKRPVTAGSRGYGYLQSAIRILQREKSIVLENVRGKGYRVCTDEQKLGVSGGYFRRAGKALKRSTRILGATDYAKLSPEKQREHNARISLNGSLALMLKTTAVKAVENKIEGGELPSSEVLNLFRT